MKKELLDIVEKNSKSFEVVFRSVAGSRLAECSKLNLEGYNALNACMLGGNENLTSEILLDTLAILSCDKNSDICLNMKSSRVVAKLYKGCNIKNIVSREELENILVGTSNESLKKDVEVNEEEEEKEEVAKEEEQSNRKELQEFYKPYYKAIVEELMKRYNDLFASGYELFKPFGILVEDGCVSLSGSDVKYSDKTASSLMMYKFFKDKLCFQLDESRSLVNIGNSMYSNYLSGKKLLYFPYKMLEFAYGRKSPTGDRQNSLHTYPECAEGKVWSSYKSILYKSIERLVWVCLEGYVTNQAMSKGIDYKSVEIIQGVGDFLDYVKKCLSICLLFIDYKSNNGIPSVFKIRVCDPNNSLGNEDLTRNIINTVFMGATGSDSFSYKPRIEEDSLVKEYSHEFNHSESQAMPLFAYRAFEILKGQGFSLSWDNMILGKFEDGTILRNGTRGISLGSKLTHVIDAGSRAGKGVMTLSILVSAICSRKVIFYLDRKPDMASVLKKIAPEMFVVNGADYVPKHDCYNQYTNQDSLINKSNIPKAVTDILKCGIDWNALGDMFYMRALKLVMGIILARGREGLSSNDAYGGKNGIFLVVDEFKNFQDGFSNIIDKMLSVIPPDATSCDVHLSKMETELEKKEEGKKNNYKEYSNLYKESCKTENYYALSYLNSLITDIEFSSSLRDAGFSSEEVELSDVFVIGQHLKHGSLEYRGFKDALGVGGRYKTIGRTGVPREVRDKLNITTESFGYSLVMFKTADAFFGRNREDGREVYLAQTNSSSNACGRLDDKASNFAYLNDFNEDVRKRIVSGRVSDNIEIANKCTYFKPFLLLNDSTSDFVEPMYDRVRAHVSKEQVIAEYPDNQDSSKLNKAVGLEEYLKLTGTSDYVDILSKGAEIANMIVKKLGYTGNGSNAPLWFQFITDLRVEWMFTVKDICDVAAGRVPDLHNPSINSVTREFYRFDKSMGMSDVRAEEQASTGFIKDVGVPDDDYSDFDEQYSNRDCETGFAMGDGEILDSINDEFDFWYDGEDDDILQDNTKDSTKDTFSNFCKTSNDVKEMNQIVDWINELIASRKIDFEVGSNGFEAKVVDNPKEDRVAPISDLGEKMSKVPLYDDNVPIQINMERLSDIITDDLIAKYAGIERIRHFGVIGGNIKVNGYFYRCKINKNFASSIPYDIRCEINSGNIAVLFNYSSLLHMPNLTELEFDSPSFVYDYVCPLLGSNSLNLDLFFKRFKRLVVLKIGNKVYTREDYISRRNEASTFNKTMRIADNYALALDKAMGKGKSSSWSYAKRSFRNKKDKLWIRAGKWGIGATGAVVSGTAQVATKVGRATPKVISGLSKGIKEIFNS